MRNRIKRIITRLRTLFGLRPKDNGEVQADAVAWAIEAANVARTVGGAESLTSDKLPYSAHVGNARECVLAKLFNFSCSIRPEPVEGLSNEDMRNGEGWVANMAGQPEAAEALARALGTKAKHLDNDTSKVPLPQPVARIATAFDNHTLPSEFVQH